MGGFPSPEAALFQIRDCLAGTFCGTASVLVGAAGTGGSLPCCQNKACGLLRIESVAIVPPPDRGSVALVRPGCRPLILNIQVIWSQCFAVFRDGSGNARPVPDLQESGLTLVASWWSALKAIRSCEPWNQNIRLLSANDDPPDGGCAGWTMRLEADLLFCG